MWKNNVDVEDFNPQELEKRFYFSKENHVTCYLYFCLVIKLIYLFKHITMEAIVFKIA